MTAITTLTYVTFSLTMTPQTSRQEQVLNYSLFTLFLPSCALCYLIPLSSVPPFFPPSATSSFFPPAVHQVEHPVRLDRTVNIVNLTSDLLSPTASSVEDPQADFGWLL